MPQHLLSSHHSSTYPSRRVTLHGVRPHAPSHAIWRDKFRLFIMQTMLTKDGDTVPEPVSRHDPSPSCRGPDPNESPRSQNRWVIAPTAPRTQRLGIRQLLTLATPVTATENKGSVGSDKSNICSRDYRRLAAVRSRQPRNGCLYARLVFSGQTLPFHRDSTESFFSPPAMAEEALASYLSCQTKRSTRSGWLGTQWAPATPHGTNELTEAKFVSPGTPARCTTMRTRRLWAETPVNRTPATQGPLARATPRSLGKMGQGSACISGYPKSEQGPTPVPRQRRRLRGGTIRPSGPCSDRGTKNELSSLAPPTRRMSTFVLPDLLEQCPRGNAGMRLVPQKATRGKLSSPRSPTTIMTIWGSRRPLFRSGRLPGAEAGPATDAKDVGGKLLFLFFFVTFMLPEVAVKKSTREDLCLLSCLA